MNILTEESVIAYFNKGFNYSQDGPGNRLVYHIYGCNLRCPWCANPECFTVNDAVKRQTVADVVAEIKRSVPMFFSGGGVTFTGGEPTLQFETLKALLTELKALNINTAIESNATHPQLAELFPLLDHLMLDLKHPDDHRHKEICGIGNRQILENIRAASCRQLALRIPLINGYNTADSDIEGFIEFILSLPENGRFTLELLPYHEYGKVKWEKNSLQYKVVNGFVSPERFAEIKNMFVKAGIETVRT